MLTENLDEIEFTLACTEIRFPDRRYRYYPQVRLYMREQGKFSLYDQTEVARGTKSPVFQEKFRVPYNPGVILSLKFELVETQSHDEHRFLGQAIMTSEELFGTSEQTKIVEIMSLPDKVCDLVIKWNRVPCQSQELMMTMAGLNLKFPTATAWFSKQEIRPFFRLGRWMPGDEFLTVYESNTLKEIRNPKWKSFKIRSSNLNKGNPVHPVSLKVMYYENGSEKTLGEAIFKLDKLSNAPTLVNLIEKGSQKEVGTMQIKSQSLLRTSKFSANEFESNVNVLLGIDFSDTQKRINSTISTHAKSSEGSLNQYQSAISELFDSLRELNGKQEIPVYGFGALKGSSSFKSIKDGSSNCFSLTQDISNPYFTNLDQVIGAYSKHITGNILGGQANFSEIIQKAIYLATFNQLRGSKEYVTLVLMTDGVIQDCENTIHSLIQAAKLPLSIIMIGMGDDFESFEALDCQLGAYETAKRDYIRFFAFKDFEEDIEQLRKKISQEISEHIVEYAQCEDSIIEDTDDQQKEVPSYLKEDLYKGGREFLKARKRLEEFSRKSLDQISIFL